MYAWVSSVKEKLSQLLENWFRKWWRVVLYFQDTNGCVVYSLVFLNHLSNRVENCISWNSFSASIEPSYIVDDADSFLWICSIFWKQPSWRFWYKCEIKYDCSSSYVKCHFVHKFFVRLVKDINWAGYQKCSTIDTSENGRAYYLMLFLD